MFSSSAWQRGHALASSTRRTAAATASASPPPASRATASRSPSASTAGPMLMADEERTSSATSTRRADKPTVVEFVEHLEPRNTIRILPYGLARRQAVHKIGADKYDGPGLAVQWVEVEGPLHDTWPPASHRRIFGDLPQEPAPIRNNSNRVEVVSKNPEADAERILRDFARRAFRRAVTDDDVKPFLALVQGEAGREALVRAGGARRPHGGPGVAGLPVPPREARQARRLRPGQPAVVLPLEHDARRGTARRSPSRGSSRDPGRCAAQVERMLKDPKAAAFTENFVGQWLGLRDIDATAPDHSSTPNTTTCSRCRWSRRRSCSSTRC